MLDIIKQPAFVRDLKKYHKKHYDMQRIFVAIELLATGAALPGKYRDHHLKGDWTGYREIHIDGDVLLIYQKDSRSLMLIRLGSHDDLFRK